MGQPIVVISTWMNQPDVLLLHKELWCAAFPGEAVRYVAYIDAKGHPDPSNYFSSTMHLDLMRTCMEHEIEFVMVPQRFHQERHILFPGTAVKSSEGSSWRNSVVCQMAWIKEVVRRPDQTRVIFVQSDIFPFQRQTWDGFLQGTSFAYKNQFRSHGDKTLFYAWEGLCGFDMREWTADMRDMVSFECGVQKWGVYTDTGGATWRILEALSASQKREWSGKESMRWRMDEANLPAFPLWLNVFVRLDPRAEDGVCFSELFDGWCFHLRAGSNWDKPNLELQQKRYYLLKMSMERSRHDGVPLLL